MDDFDAVLAFYSNKNFLIKELEKALNKKYIKTIYFHNSKRASFLTFNYLIINLLEQKFLLNNVLHLMETFSCKIIILFPYYVTYDNLLNDYQSLLKVVRRKENIQIILIPEIIGSEIKYCKNYQTHELIRKSLLSERAVVGSGYLTISSLKEVVNEIIKNILSFGEMTKSVLLEGKTIYLKLFAKYLFNEVVEKRNIFSNELLVKVVRADIIKKHRINIKKEIKNTRDKFISDGLLDDKQSKIVKQNKIGKIWNKFKIALLIVLVIYLIPLGFIFISFCLLFISYIHLYSNPKIAVNLSRASYNMSSVANNISFNNPIYLRGSNFFIKTSLLTKSVAELSLTVNDFMEHFINGTSYNVEAYVDTISANLEKIFVDMLFLEGELANGKNPISKYVYKRYFSYGSDWAEIKEQLFNFKLLVSRTSDLMGWKGAKKYLILFQNDSELRPTGGFIGSFALITLDGGKITETVVYDVYSADGQLKGHVEPPLAIKTYLKEGGWYLRDANWDPDFRLSAEKISWFLDKEIGEKVDGVIGIDTFFVKDILSLLGAISLTDHNKVVTKDNLNLTIQNEIRSSFFPGSGKKQSILTELLRNLLTEIKSFPVNQKIQLIRLIHGNLSKRHIQLYFKDNYAQQAVRDLSFSGEILIDSNCGVRCYQDYYAVVDANLGVNKLNPYVERSQYLKTEISKNLIKHELLLTYKNTTGLGLAESGIYKTYTRLILPTNAKISNVDNLALINNRQEAGVYLEINPQSSKSILFVWTIPVDMSNGGEYRMTVRKQAGTKGDGFRSIFNSSDLFLTDKGFLEYNQILSEDVEAIMLVKPKK